MEYSFIIAEPSTFEPINFSLIFLFSKAVTLIFAYQNHKTLAKKFINSRKFYISRNNNKVDSVEPGSIVITHLLS